MFRKKELWDLRDLVEKLRGEYADTDVAKDRRRPSLLEMEKVVADVPKAITVRLDGTGDFTSIQAAIDAAPPKSLIEIGDDGPYHEKILIPKDKDELRLRGKKGCWPVVTSVQLPPDNRCLLTVEGSSAFLERLVLVHDNPGSCGACVTILARDFRLRWAIVSGLGTLVGINAFGYERKCECEECLVTVGALVQAPALFRNCLFAGRAVRGDGFPVQIASPGSAGELQLCTLTPRLTGYWPARDSILGRAEYPSPLVNCDLLVGNVSGTGCFQADPMFVDPENFDYRLKPGSPCIGKASDGGDIGCRYTPEMEDLCKTARDLRRKGILKF